MKSKKLIFTMFLLLFVAAACSSTRPGMIWMDRYLEAASAHDESRWQDALTHYDALEKHAPSKEDRRMVQYRKAKLWDDRGQTDKAIPMYRALFEDAKVSDEWGAESMHRVYVLTKDTTLLTPLLTRYGNTTPAQHAIHEMRKLAKAQSSTKALALELESLQGQVHGDVVDYLLFWRAVIWKEDLGQWERAIGLWKKVVQDHQEGSLVDDARWEIAQTYDQQGQLDQALKMYDELVESHREHAWFMGDYNSEHADDARFRQGEIYMSRGQSKACVATFEMFIDEFPHNRRVDDAAWLQVQCQGELIKHLGGYEAKLKDFIKSYPESRYVRQAKKILAQSPHSNAKSK